MDPRSSWGRSLPYLSPKAATPQFTERDAEKLSPEQATALVRVLDLQAKWDGLLADKQQKTSMPDLHARQRANGHLARGTDV